jgi:hypothetical protein
MTITLNHQQKFVLAETLAHTVHFLVTNRNLRLINQLPDSSFDREIINSIRAAVASIPDRYDRRSFAGDIKWHLAKIRKERGTEVRGRDYVARVQAFRRAA